MDASGTSSEPGGDTGFDLAELSALEEELERRRERLLRSRGYFAWRLPVLLGVWYLTRGTPLHAWVLLAFVVAVALDYLVAELRVRTAEERVNVALEAMRPSGPGPGLLRETDP